MDFAAFSPVQKASKVSAKRKAVRCSNTQTAIKKTNIEKIMNAIKSIAACARSTCATSHFSLNPHTGMGKLESTPKRAGIVHPTPELLGPMRKNIPDIAVNRPERTVFSRPEFEDGPNFRRIYGFGRDGLVRKAGRVAISMFLTSRPPFARKNASGGFLSHIGAEAMTMVNTPITSKPDTIARQQAIETALESALYFIRTDHPDYSLCLATARARRALSLLKQACADAAKNGGAQ